MTDSTTATAAERLAAVVRFAREVDWTSNEPPDSLERGYRYGYSAARGELRALLGIEEG